MELIAISFSLFQTLLQPAINYHLVGTHRSLEDNMCMHVFMYLYMYVCKLSQSLIFIVREWCEDTLFFLFKKMLLCRNCLFWVSIFTTKFHFQEVPISHPSNVNVLSIHIF